MEQNEIQSSIERLHNEVTKVIKGKDDVVSRVIVAIMAGGHILLEDVPGLGKTTMAMSFSKALGFKSKRIQFTPDTMPSDIMGMSIFNEQSNAFEYSEGAAVGCNMLLGDEINRTSSKTQSALLEAMAEGKVTVDGNTHILNRPFVVMATQNPVTSSGTQPLPDSQLDRFMVRLSMGYPGAENQLEILKNISSRDLLEVIEPVLTAEKVADIQDYIKNLEVADEVYMYMIRLCEATREDSQIELGISPRGVGALSLMSKSHAVCDGRDYVTPDDVESVFEDSCAHRIFLYTKARREGVTSQKVLERILKSVEKPKLLRPVG